MGSATSTLGRLGAGMLAAYAIAGSTVRLALGRDALHDASAVQVLVPLAVVVGTAYLLLARMPGHGVTWVLTVGAAAAVTGQWAGAVADRVQDPIAQQVLGRLVDLAWIAEVPVLALLVLLFPTGRLPGPRWRPVLQVQLAALGVLAAGVAVLGSGHPLLPVVGVPVAAVLVGTTAASAASLALRWRRGDPDERAGMRAFVLVAALLVASYLLGAALLALNVVPGPVVDALHALLLAALPAAVGYGVLRHRLYDIDVVLRRVAVWAALSVALLGLYLAVALAVDALLGGRRGIDVATLAAAAVVALALAPLRRTLQAGVDRLLYGRRGSPAEVLRMAGRELAGAGAVADVPPRLARLVTSTLRLPWAAVELDREGRWERVAASGASNPQPDAVCALPMTAAGEVPARLLVAPRRGEKALSASDRRLLDELAAQVAPALLSVRLVDELERSRERLLAAGIEERRRLRHDLHDTLSPALGGMRLALDAARRLLATRPERADALLATVQDEAERTGEAVRDMLVRLRPAPVDGDLVAAVLAHVEPLGEAAGLEVVVGADGTLPDLPPAVTEPAYRIAVEAVTNTARHARARRCSVQLRAAEELTVEVRDDGRGLPKPHRPGIGCESMRRRAAELGGRCEIASAANGGTRVLAVLPLTGQP